MLVLQPRPRLQQMSKHLIRQQSQDASLLLLSLWLGHRPRLFSHSEISLIPFWP
jgi:hypothetical protein